MALATIPQYIPFRPILLRDEPDVPDSVHRSTEERALRQIAMRSRYREQAGGRARLPKLHEELLKLERGAMQHLPQLTFDERMEFIRDAARLRDVSFRQIEALLDQASGIIMLRELSGLDTVIDDMDEHIIKRLYHGTNGRPARRTRPMQQVTAVA